MKIWPIAPQAAKPRIVGPMDGLRVMKDVAERSSEEEEAGRSGEDGRKGQRRR